MAPGKGNLIIVVSKFSLLEDCRRVGKTLYLIQNKPAGYPKQDLWSSNSTLDQFLASPAFENLEVERKNNVLRGVNANFLIETVEQTRVERDESADELGQDYQPTQQLFVNMERPTLPASTGSMDDLIASLKHKSEMEGVSRNTSNASPAKSQNMSTMSNNRLSRLPPGSRPELIRHSIQPSATSSGNAQSGTITSRPPSQAVATPSRLQNSSSNGRSTPRIQLSSTPRSSSFGSLSQRPKSPAKLSVVIGGARSVTTPRPQQKFSALRIEVPSNTPEKLLSKQLPLDSFMNSQGQVKKRGRPFQSKEAEEKARLKAVIRQQKTDGTYVHDFKKRIGRPARIPPKHTIVTVPEFEFAVFRCKFAGCPAQLSNTETLKKHVYIVHGKRGRRKNEGPKEYVCTWEGCCELAGGRSDDDLAMERVSTSDLKFKWKTEFDRLDQWKEHVDNEHIDYVRWTQGDGPLPQDLREHSQTLFYSSSY